MRLLHVLDVKILWLRIEVNHHEAFEQASRKRHYRESS